MVTFYCENISYFNTLECNLAHAQLEIKKLLQQIFNELKKLKTIGLKYFCKIGQTKVIDFKLVKV